MTPWEDQQNPDRGKLYSFFIKYITRGKWGGEEEPKDEKRSKKHIKLWQSRGLIWTLILNKIILKVRNCAVTNIW